MTCEDVWRIWRLKRLCRSRNVAEVDMPLGSVLVLLLLATETVCGIADVLE
jgi:hypothetical protein